MVTDTERLDWLAKWPGIGLVNDDNGHWAVSGTGFQNVVAGDKAQYVETTFVVEADEWHEDIRDAIDAAMEELGTPVVEEAD